MLEKRVFVAGGWIYLDHNNRIVAPRGTIRAWYNQKAGIITVEINNEGDHYWEEIKIS